MKKERIKTKIINSAIVIFAQKGYHGATMSDISEAAGMTPGNMYHYFSSKKEIVKEAIVFVTNMLSELIKEINERDISPKDKIYEFVKQYHYLQKTNPELIKFFFRIYLSYEEIFCQNTQKCFEFGTELMNEVAQMFYTDKNKERYDDKKAKISFAVLFGILGGVDFMNNQRTSDISTTNQETDELSTIIYKALK